MRGMYARSFFYAQTQVLGFFLLQFGTRWGNIIIQVEESGGEWYKVVDKFITLWKTTEGRCLCYVHGRIEDKFRNISRTSKDARKFSRFFFAGAAAVELDKQGRILLPPVLREYANLQKDVVLVGVLSRVEIWDKDRWQENTYDEDEMDEIAEHMADLGFSI